MYDIILLVLNNMQMTAKSEELGHRSARCRLAFGHCLARAMLMSVLIYRDMSTRRTASFATPILAFALLAGCGSSKTASSESSGSSAGSAQISADARAKAKDIFSTRCSACHGLAGKGDGPGAASLTPKPPNFHDAGWQSSITDENIEKSILYGGAAIGKSPMMPGNPDLQSQPDVVAALREAVRQFGK
jgi:cytochrome c553